VQEDRTKYGKKNSLENVTGQVAFSLELYPEYVRKTRFH